jgi:hypothetical protein
MSDVTGGSLVGLARHSGMADDLEVAADGSIVISAQGKRYTLDTQSHTFHEN